jgi:hypothetical protein
MRIKSPPTTAELRRIVMHFQSGSDKSTHFVKVGNEHITFPMQHCDKCNAECQGANPITFVDLTEAQVKVLLACGLVESKVMDELGCNDDGDCVCPACND